MADTNVRVIVDAIDNASNVLKNIGKNIEDSLGKQTQTNVTGLGAAMEGMVGSIGKIALGAGIAGAVIGGIGIGVSKVTEAFQGLMEASQNDQQVQAQTNAVLASTGDISGATAQQVQELANSIEKTTPVAHDSAQAAENMLLTFTSIGHSILPDATKATIDLATALNGGAIPSQQQLIDTSIQVGKALNDPIIGMTALRREGVSFNDTFKQVVEQLIATGQGAKAQKLIIQELNNEFGGSAQAALHTYGGAMQNLQNQFTDFKETIGNALAPALEMLANDLSGNLASGTQATASAMQTLQGYAIALAGVLEVLGQIAVGVAQAIYGAFTGGIIGAATSIQNTWNSVGDTIKRTQENITDTALMQFARQQAAATSSADGRAIAESAASQKIQKAMADETATYERELAKRNADFEDSLAQMVRSHLDKKNTLIQDIADENASFNEQMNQRVENFKDKMGEMEEAHQQKVDDLNQQLTDETDSFNQNMADQLATFQDTMDSMKQSHEDKVTKLQRDYDREVHFGQGANDAKAMDIKQQIDDENAMYAQQQQKEQTKYDTEVAKLQTANTKKLTTIQAEILKENAAYQDQVDKETRTQQQETQKLQEEHDKRVSNYQNQLNQEKAILDKHTAEVQQVEQQAAEDDITRLEKKHAQENADALAQHLQKMKDIPAQQQEEAMVGGVAYNNEIEKKTKELFDNLKKQTQQGHKDNEQNWLQAGISAAEKWIGGIQKGIEDKIRGMAGNTGVKVFNFAESLISKLTLGALGIPGFQTGGVVPGPIGMPMPIVAHGGEYVTPAGISPRGQGNGMGGGVTFNVSIGLYSGSETEKRQIAKMLYGALLQVAQMQHKTVAELMGG